MLVDLNVEVRVKVEVVVKEEVKEEGGLLKMELVLVSGEEQVKA